MSSIVPDLSTKQVWFFTGSQHLYGEETLRQVAAQSQQIARTLAESADIPVTVVWKPVLTDSESIGRAALEAEPGPRHAAWVAARSVDPACRRRSPRTSAARCDVWSRRSAPSSAGSCWSARSPS